MFAGLMYTFFLKHVYSNNSTSNTGSIFTLEFTVKTRGVTLWNIEFTVKTRGVILWKPWYSTFQIKMTLLNFVWQFGKVSLIFNRKIWEVFKKLVRKSMSSHTWLMTRMNFGVHTSKTWKDIVKISVSGVSQWCTRNCTFTPWLWIRNYNFFKSSLYFRWLYRSTHLRWLYRF